MSAVLIGAPSATGRSPAGAIITYRQTHSQPIDLAIGSCKSTDLHPVGGHTRRPQKPRVSRLFSTRRQALFMPNAGYPIEHVKRIATVIEANVQHLRGLPSKLELLRLERIVELPRPQKPLERKTVDNLYSRANWKFLFVWLQDVDL